MRRLYITNSANPQAIGDSISAVPAVAEVSDGQPMEVWWEARIMRGLFDIPGVQQAIGSPPEGVEYQRLDIQQVARGFMHLGIPITEAWARAMGTTLPDDWVWPEMWGEQVWDATCLGFKPENPYALISPYSYSDLGTGCKEWAPFKWFGLVEQLKEAGLDIGLLGATTDPELPIPAIDFRVLGKPLQDVGHWMREAAVVVTIDNGMNWMAQAVGAKHVLITAAAHPPAWTANHGPNGRNIRDARTASIREVLGAALALVKGSAT